MTGRAEAGDSQEGALGGVPSQVAARTRAETDAGLVPVERTDAVTASADFPWVPACAPIVDPHGDAGRQADGWAGNVTGQGYCNENRGRFQAR